ncbi:MAG: alkaline shock response membrane anchor protein AmaP [Christensenellales bacterium]|jgi:uncharacterized alkaline shock family protein YloU
MQVNVARRIIAGTLIVLCVAAFVFFAVMLWDRPLAQAVVRLLSGSALWFVAPAVSAAALLCAAGALYVIFAPGVRASGDIIVRKDDKGTLSICLGTLETIGTIAAKEVQGLKDIKMKLTAHEGDVCISARVSMSHEADIPEATALIQEAMGKAIYERTGIMVKQIDISVAAAVSVGERTASPRVR